MGSKCLFLMRINHGCLSPSAVLQETQNDFSQWFCIFAFRRILSKKIHKSNLIYTASNFGLKDKRNEK